MSRKWKSLKLIQLWSAILQKCKRLLLPLWTTPWDEIRLWMTAICSVFGRICLSFLAFTTNEFSFQTISTIIENSSNFQTFHGLYLYCVVQKNLIFLWWVGDGNILCNVLKINKLLKMYVARIALLNRLILFYIMERSDKTFCTFFPKYCLIGDLILVIYDSILLFSDLEEREGTSFQCRTVPSTWVFLVSHIFKRAGPIFLRRSLLEKTHSF